MLLLDFPVDSLQLIFSFNTLPELINLSGITKNIDIYKYLRIIYKTDVTKNKLINNWIDDYNLKFELFVKNTINIIIKTKPISYYTLNKLHQMLYIIYYNLDTIRYYPYIDKFNYIENNTFLKNYNFYKCIKYICRKREMNDNLNEMFNLFRSILIMYIHFFNQSNINELEIYLFYNNLQKHISKLYIN